MKQRVLLVFSLFLALLLVGCQEKVDGVEAGQEISAIINIVIDEEVETEEFTFQSGTNLMDIMKENYEIETAFEDAFIVGINGVLADDAEKIGWTYYLNGEMAMVGAKELFLEDGDLVDFKYESWE